MPVATAHPLRGTSLTERPDVLADTPMGAAIEAYRARDPASDPDAALEAELIEISSAIDRLEGERLRRLRAWHQRGAWANDGSRSSAAALARRTGMADAAARERLRAAAQFGDAPLTEEALSEGRLSWCKARLFAELLGRGATQELRKQFGRAERALVDACAELSVRDTRYVLRNFRAHADPDHHERDWDKAYDRRGLHLSRTFDGNYQLDGFLDPESGQIVKHALDALERRLFRTDHREQQAAAGSGSAGDNGSDDTVEGPPRTAAQRRADALVALARSVLDEDPSGERDEDLGGVDRPVVAAITDLTPDGEGTTVLVDSEVPVPPRAAERMRCDAGMVRIRTMGASAPLDVGRTARTVTTPILRALVMRDGRCAFPGCHHPPRLCQAHHIVHWEHGGATSLDNLVLLCPHHHRFVHERSWRCWLDAEIRRPRFAPPGQDHAEPPDPSPLDLSRRARRLGHAA